MRIKDRNNLEYKEKLKLLIMEAREWILRTEARIDTLTEALTEYEKFEEENNKKEYKI